MATALKKKQTVEAAPVADDREALTAAIHREFAAKNALAAKQEAIARCRTNIDEAGQRLDRAHKAVPKARGQREAVLAGLKAEASGPLYGAPDADHEVGLQAAKAVKAALLGLRTSSAAPLPKV